METFLEFCGAKVFDTLHLRRISKVTIDFFELKKQEQIKPERETPALLAFESYLTGTLMSLYSSGSVSHEQDSPHAHGNFNYDRVVRERGR